MKDLILEELERREALKLAFHIALTKHFNFYPHEYIPRLRRDEVHITVLKELGFTDFKYAKPKRIIKECLAELGVRFTIVEGRRMFVGMDYKYGKPRQNRLHSGKRSRNQQDSGVPG